MLFNEMLKNLNAKKREGYAAALKQAENEAENAFEEYHRFEQLIADAEYYGVWDDTISDLRSQKKVLEAEWLRRKSIADLAKRGFEATYGNESE